MTQPDCNCDSIMSPQLEWTPGPHHDRGQCGLWRPAVDEATLTDVEVPQ